MFYSLYLHKLINGDYRVIQTHLRLKSNKSRLDRLKWQYNDNKLDNNLSRAKSNIFNILSFNKFEFFYTQTISSIYSRHDLKRLVSKIREKVKVLRRDYDDLYYLFVPEYHSDGECWHIHGFLSKGFERFKYLNDNGYWSLSCFDNIGWNSVSKIKHYSACCKYALKYITKELVTSVKKGDRLYYCSKGLVRSNLIEKGDITQIAPLHFDYKNEYVFKTDVPKDRFDIFYERLHNMNEFHYRKC